MRKIVLTVLSCSLFLFIVSTVVYAEVPDFGFESGDWGGWYSEGSENDVLNSDTFDGGNAGIITVLPFGDYMGRINSYNGHSGGDSESEGEFNVWNNFILTSFVWDGEEDLSFWYNFFTWDYYDFDEPGFSVWLDDDEEILYWAAGDLDDTEGEDEGVDYTGWTQFIYPAADIAGLGYGEGDEIEIEIYSGNTGDDDMPSWVYIDNGPGEVTQSVIPEPATMLLLGLGILGLAGFGRKR